MAVAAKHLEIFSLERCKVSDLVGKLQIWPVPYNTPPGRKTGNKNPSFNSDIDSLDSLNVSVATRSNQPQV